MEIMGLLIAGLACALIVMVSKWWDLRQENESLNELSVQRSRNISQAEVKESLTNESDQVGTRDLLLNVLTQIGCQYELGEDIKMLKSFLVLLCLSRRTFFCRGFQ